MYHSDMAQNANNAPSSTSTPASHDLAIGRTLPDESLYAPNIFHGRPTDDAHEFLAYVEHYATFRHLSEQQRLELFPLLLRHSASDWYGTLSEADVTSWQTVTRLFLSRFGRIEATRWRDTSTLWRTSQAANQTVDEYFSHMVKLARRVPHLEHTVIQDAIINGLSPSVRAHVIQCNVQSMKQLLDAARIGELAVSSDNGTMSTLLEELRATKQQHSKDIQQLSSRLDKLSTTALEDRRRHSSSSPRRHICFDYVSRRSPSPPPPSPPRYATTRYDSSANSSAHSHQQRHYIRRQPSTFTASFHRKRGMITKHQSYPDLNESCNMCKRPEYFRAECHQGRRGPGRSNI